jgi:hypothetical protein
MDKAITSHNTDGNQYYSPSDFTHPQSPVAFSPIVNEAQLAAVIAHIVKDSLYQDMQSLIQKNIAAAIEEAFAHHQLPGFNPPFHVSYASLPPPPSIHQSPVSEPMNIDDPAPLALPNSPPIDSSQTALKYLQILLQGHSNPKFHSQQQQKMVQLALE